MIKFEYRDIKVEAIVKMTRYDYKDDNNVGRTRYDRNVIVVVQFDDFAIFDDFYELALVKSTLNYFMQSYWKRSSKQGSNIDLSTSLYRLDPMQKLNFTARQKNHTHSLEISLMENEQQIWSIYLSGQEVLLLETAISKAIAIMTPRVETF